MRIPGAYNRPVVCHALSAPTAVNGASMCKCTLRAALASTSRLVSDSVPSTRRVTTS
jgi:hypothetical protein